jgi:hypothetical protein
MTVTYTPFQSQSGFSSPGFVVGLNGAITATAIDINSLKFAGVELINATSLGNTIVTSNLTTVGTLTRLTVNSTTPVTITSTGAIVLSPGTLGTINNMSIGATTPSTGAFTTLTAPNITTTTLTASNNIFIGDLNIKSLAAALAVALS